MAHVRKLNFPIVKFEPIPFYPKLPERLLGAVRIIKTTCARDLNTLKKRFPTCGSQPNFLWAAKQASQISLCESVLGVVLLRNHLYSHKRWNGKLIFYGIKHAKKIIPMCSVLLSSLPAAVIELCFISTLQSRALESWNRVCHHCEITYWHAFSLVYPHIVLTEETLSQ